MGITYMKATVTGPGGAPATLEFLVDSGATCTVLPHETWRAIGLAPKRTIVLRLADGSAIERRVSECHIRLAEGEAHTPVVLGEPGDAPLLGVVTLENIGLVFDPFQRTLRPMRMLLAERAAYG